MGWKKNLKKKAGGLGGAGIGALIGSSFGPVGTIAGASLGAYIGDKLTGGKSNKPQTVQSSGWTPEQQQMAQLMLTQATGDVPAYSQMRRQTYSNLADLVGNIQPNLQAQVIDPMQRQYELQRDALNAQMGKNYWNSSRMNTLANFDLDYNIQKAKNVSDLLMRANAMKMQGYGQLLEQDPSRMYMQMLQTTPVETAVIPKTPNIWEQIFPF